MMIRNGGKEHFDADTVEDVDVDFFRHNLIHFRLFCFQYDDGS